MIRRRLLPAVLVILLCCAPALAQDEAIITLPPLALEVGAAGVIEVTADCGAVACSAFDLTLNYDPTLINIETLTLGDYLGAQAFVIRQQVDNEAGRISYAAAALGAPAASENAVLFTIALRGIAPGEMQFTAAQAQIGDLNPLPARVEGGKVYIAQAAATPSPLPPPTATPIPTETFVPMATPDPLDRALNFSGGNRNWTPFISNLNGTVMVLVPAGSFFMGSTQEQIDAAFAECNRINRTGSCQPGWFDGDLGVGMQTISQPFWLDWTEVSRAQYATCVAAGVCDPVAANTASNTDAQPVSGVTWGQAGEYCAWRGARLPTEAEWEYAARGPDGWLYPWGDEFSGSAANHCDGACVATTWGAALPLANPADDDGYATTAPIVSYLQTASWVDALNMAGNVWEWTSSTYVAYPYSAASENPNDQTTARVSRGGAYNSSSLSLRTTDRSELPPNTVNDAVGFRCALDTGLNAEISSTAAPPPTAAAPQAFALWGGAVTYTSNFTNFAGCAWQGVGGEVLDAAGQPLNDVTIHVFGTGIDLYTTSGSHAAYGLSGWEIALSTNLTANSYSVEVQAPDGSAISPPIPITFAAGNCDRNLALVNFVQTQP